MQTHIAKEKAAELGFPITDKSVELYDVRLASDAESSPMPPLPCDCKRELEEARAEAHGLRERLAASEARKRRLKDG